MDSNETKKELWAKVLDNLDQAQVCDVFDQLIATKELKTRKILYDVVKQTGISNEDLQIMFQVTPNPVPRKKASAKAKQQDLVIYEDLVQRDYDNTAHDQLINGADITMLDAPWDCKARHLYLAIVKNYRTKAILGWALSTKEDLQLVMDCFQYVDPDILNGSIVHMPPKPCYCEPAYLDFLKAHDCTPSMAKNGNLMDNRETKFWFSVLKTECISRLNIRKMKYIDLLRELEEYMDYYNNTRIQKKLGSETPAFRLAELKNSK